MSLRFFLKYQRSFYLLFRFDLNFWFLLLSLINSIFLINNQFNNFSSVWVSINYFLGIFLMIFVKLKVFKEIVPFLYLVLFGRIFNLFVNIFPQQEQKISVHFLILFKQSYWLIIKVLSEDILGWLILFSKNQSEDIKYFYFNNVISWMFC